MKTVYVAHVYGGVAANRDAAESWAAWVAETFKVAVVADYLWLTRQWDESKHKMGMAINMELIKRCDELWLVGPMLSAGMEIEAERAGSLGIPVRSFVGVDRETVGAGAYSTDGPNESGDYWVVVCGNCLCASCWHGEFYCDRAKSASIINMKASVLRKLEHEHPDYFSRKKIQAVTGQAPRDVA